jgi:hypothetical protein
MLFPSQFDLSILPLISLCDPCPRPNDLATYLPATCKAWSEREMTELEYVHQTPNVIINQEQNNHGTYVSENAFALVEGGGAEQYVQMCDKIAPN